MNTAIDKTSSSIASADAALAGLQGQAPSLTQAISQGNDLLGEARATAGNSITSLSKALSEGSLALTKTSASANGCDWQANGYGHIYDHPHRQLARVSPGDDRSQ